MRSSLFSHYNDSDETSYIGSNFIGHIPAKYNSIGRQQVFKMDDKPRPNTRVIKESIKGTTCWQMSDSVALFADTITFMDMLQYTSAIFG